MKKNVTVSVGLKNCMEGNILTINLERKTYLEINYELDEQEVNVLDGLIQSGEISSVEGIKEKLEEMECIGDEYEYDSEGVGDLEEMNKHIVSEILLVERLS